MEFSGRIADSVPRAMAVQLIQGLAFWSVWPVTCVLCAGREGANWCEWWTDRLGDIAEHRHGFSYLVRLSEAGRWER